LIDLDEASERCTTDADRTDAPDPGRLDMSLDTAHVVSGEATVLTVNFRNASSEPLHLVFAIGCSFDVVVYHDDGRVANEEGESAVMGGLCGTGSAIELVMPAGGVMRKQIRWDARRDRFVCANDICEVEPGSPIEPGRYRIEVDTPFSDPVDGNEQHRRSRRVSATLEVVAP
jgi:hypothetical protein